MAQRLRTEESPPAWVTATGALLGVLYILLWDILRSSLSRLPQLHTATRLFVGGSRKQEMRDCEGIKISLGIGPLSRRSEALLSFFFFLIFISWRLILYNIVVVFVIHLNE